MELLTLDKLPRKVLAKLDIQTAFMASRLVVAAERLQIFQKLHEKKLRATTIGRMLKIHGRYINYFLDALVSMGLLKKEGDLYHNSALAGKYFVKERSVYWTRQFSAECVENFEEFTVLEKILKSGKSAYSVMRKKRQDYVEVMAKNPVQARDFTYMLYHYHKDNAERLAANLDLRAFRRVLDVGGGSGVMSIALVRRNRQLQACVLDIEAVCRIARQIIKKEGLSRRIKTRAGDLRRELPSGYDVIMFCDIGAVHPPLLRMAYNKLPDNGMIVLVDRFLSADRTEPLDRILHQFIATSFGVETYGEMRDALKDCGFKNVRTRNIHKDIWLISGLKKKT